LGRSQLGSRLLRRHVAVPTDHGSWVFLASPLLIGLFAGGRIETPTIYLLVASICGFLIRQPITIVVKILSGRRTRDDLTAALFWTVAYSLVGLLHVAGLVMRGFAYVLYLAVPAVPVFGCYLYLVGRRAERRQILLEVLASGAMALSAPAALWVGLGAYDSRGWLLWILTWAQNGASIVYAYVRLEQRVRRGGEVVAIRYTRLAVAFATTNLLAAIAFASLGTISPWVGLAFAAQWVEVLWGIRHPATGQRPRAIGMRQLIVTTIFTSLFVIGVRS
jgi:hypothetical protein